MGLIALAGSSRGLLARRDRWYDATVNTMSPTLRCALRGACIGAFLLGVAGLITGIVSLGMHLPIPPMLLTELGAMLGGVLGCVIGFVCAFRLGRCLLAGLLGGAGFAMGVAVLLGVEMSWETVLRFTLLGAFLGCQAALFVTSGPSRRGPGSVFRLPAQE